IHERKGVVVQHDRGEDFMGAKTRLENARHGGPEKAAENARQQGQQDMHDRWQSVQVVPDEDAEERPDVELAFSADVEEAGAKTQGDAKPQKNIWRGRDQG